MVGAYLGRDPRLRASRPGCLSIRSSKSPIAENGAAVFVFTDGAHRLDVINLNATGTETATGVDLLYHHHDWGSMIAVQYKRVDARAHGDRLAVVDERLPKQLKRMLDLEALTAPTHSPSDYRLGPGFSFVKLARTTPVNPDGAMVRGIYVPARLLTSLLDSGALAGPRGGQYIGYDNLGRWFSNTDFTQLVRNGWIGSAGLDVTRLRAWIRQRLRRGRSVLVANHRERST